MRTRKQIAAQLKAAKASAAKRKKIGDIKKQFKFVEGIHPSDPRRGPAMVALMGAYKDATATPNIAGVKRKK